MERADCVLTLVCVFNYVLGLKEELHSVIILTKHTFDFLVYNGLNEKMHQDERAIKTHQTAVYKGKMTPITTTIIYPL